MSSQSTSSASAWKGRIRLTIAEVWAVSTSKVFLFLTQEKNVNSNKNWPKKIKVNIDSAYQPWFRVHLCLGTVATSKLTSRILCSITRWASMAFIYAPWSCRRSYVPSNGVPWIMSHVVPPTPRIIATIFRYNDKNSTDSLKSSVFLSEQLNNTTLEVACKNSHLLLLLHARSISPGGMSVLQRQKFHTDDKNKCLHN